MLRRSFLKLAAVSAVPMRPEQIAVLTFDGGDRAFLDKVAPLLREYGFGATFFASHAWMVQQPHLLNWQDFAHLHQQGFEIGNQSWTGRELSIPRNAWRFAGELALVEGALQRVGVPKPVSFAYPHDAFGPEADTVLLWSTYRFGRRGPTPEPGLFNPRLHSHRLIPVAESNTAPPKKSDGIPVFRFGTPVEMQIVRRLCEDLKSRGYRGVALRELEPFIPGIDPPDPLLQKRFPPSAHPLLPDEVIATQANLRSWMENMIVDHRYTLAEAASTAGISEDDVGRLLREWKLDPERRSGSVRVLPYPGGARHPRIGLREGAVDPMRGTKASVFLPWDTYSYVVVDLPEVIYSDLGSNPPAPDLMCFLAHTWIVPTFWDAQNVVLSNVDWQSELGGGLAYKRTLPNGVVFGASIRPQDGQVHVEIWLRNGSSQPVSRIESQVCIMLKGAPRFNAQTSENKRFGPATAAVRDGSGKRWIVGWFERPKRAGSGNELVPCMNLHPVLPDCAAGQTVRVRGKLWFYEGADIEKELR